ncbi:hypothetical protein [Streptomyces iconiensis]|uniref:Alpha/beta hydrolase n=1 Tax=Streptomyces iconiensis TaxID=1384038 RepID=A0ABT6ZNS6_9ACTN|nr:hypothetical protein [Streptomyces iconiensis]MDJ1130701.1 hypothetical protein [Streptomyces iconiensis]
MSTHQPPELVLVHSPLTGPGTWQPVAEVLRQHGRKVSLPSLTTALTAGGPYYPALVSAAAGQARLGEQGAPVVLVGHSGAGPLLPALARSAARARTVAGTVYADAQLPHPGRSWLEEAPPELAEQIAGLAAGGQLPPWNTWFPADVIAHELPDPAVRDRFLAEIPRVPLAYLGERAPEAATDPDHARTAYLRLSGQYEAMAVRAEANGHRVLRRTSHHLGLVTDPEGTAVALEKLADGFPPA